MAERRYVEIEALTDLITATRDQSENMVLVCEALLKRLEPEEVKEKPKNVVTVPEQTFDLLKFEAQKGEKLGEFEIADKKNSIAQNWTQAFNILNQNNATINNRFHGPSYIYAYWIYNERIFRKRLKGSPASALPQAQSNVANLFPQDLAEILTFKEEEAFIIVKPRQFLGSDNFSKIAAIVRSANGEYISAGKTSHFRIPKKV